MSVEWDKQLMRQLIQEGFDREKAGYVIGIVAEHRQIADLQGYKRGFDSGYAEALRKSQALDKR